MAPDSLNERLWNERTGSEPVFGFIQNGTTSGTGKVFVASVYKSAVGLDLPVAVKSTLIGFPPFPADWPGVACPQ
jgi:hypothetical protein